MCSAVELRANEKLVLALDLGTLEKVVVGWPNLWPSEVRRATMLCVCLLPWMLHGNVRQLTKLVTLFHKWGADFVLNNFSGVCVTQNQLEHLRRDLCSWFIGT